MSWKNNYQASEQGLWQGRDDAPPASCFFQIVEHLNLLNPLKKCKDMTCFAILGFCCDEGIRRNQGRTGAAEGPTAIRSMLAKMPVQRSMKFYDAGNIICTNQNLETAQAALGEAVALLLKHDITPIVLGGGHEVAWGHYQGIASALPDMQLGIVNFDAHYDMRPLSNAQQGSSGTPFLQIAEAMQKAKQSFHYHCIGLQHAGNTKQLKETAQSYDVHAIFADDLHLGKILACEETIQHAIKRNDIIYLTLCLDVFATPYAPGVSAPQALGLTPWQVIPYLRTLANSGKVISYDIAELSPTYDQDNRTAKLAANFVYEIIHHHASK